MNIPEDLDRLSDEFTRALRTDAHYCADIVERMMHNLQRMEHGKKPVTVERVKREDPNSRRLCAIRRSAERAETMLRLLDEGVEPADVAAQFGISVRGMRIAVGKFQNSIPV